MNLQTNGQLPANKAVKQDDNANTVRVTKDYAKFNKIRGNRDLRPGHLKKLADKIRQNNLLKANPIVVNERLEVVDGQHRLAVAERMGLDIYYIIVPGLQLRDVQDTNAVKATWSADEHAYSYVALGNPHYIQYLQFKSMYKFGHKESILILTGLSPNPETTRDFRDGLITVHDWEYSCKVADMIMDFEPFYSGFRRRSFIMAMIRVFKHPQYDHDQMMKKMRYLSTKMVDCVTWEDYVLLIQRLYNYQSRGKKVKFL